MDGRQADAAHRDAGAFPDIAQHVPAVDAHAGAGMGYRAHFLNDPGKHYWMTYVSLNDIGFDGKFIGRDGMDANLMELNGVGAAQAARSARYRKRLQAA